MKTKMHQVTLSQAISGYMLNIEGRRLSQNTIDDYNRTLRKFQAHIGDPLINNIDSEAISVFLAAQQVSNKTASNYHSCLSSFWSWLCEQHMANENIIRQTKRPKPEKRGGRPFGRGLKSGCCWAIWKNPAHMLVRENAVLIIRSPTLTVTGRLFFSSWTMGSGLPNCVISNSKTLMSRIHAALFLAKGPKSVMYRLAPAPARLSGIM